MPKAKRKHTPKPPQRQPRTRRLQKTPADPSIALGLRYFAAYQAHVIADGERAEMEGSTREKYPPAPAEIIIPHFPKSNVLRAKEEIQRLPEPARRRLLLMLWQEQGKRAKIDRETGYAAKVAEVRRLQKIANALRVLWLNEPATTICGIALKLRGWLDDVPEDKRDMGGHIAIAALQDAERLCGIPHAPIERPHSTITLAEQTRADFAAHISASERK